MINKNRLQIVDSHCHYGYFGRRTFFNKSISPLHGFEISSRSALIKYITKRRIKFAVVVPLYSPDPTSAFSLNKPIVNCASKSNGKIIPGIWVDPSPSVREHLAEALRLADERRVKVFKLSPSTWEGNYSPDPSTWDNVFIRGLMAILEPALAFSCILQIHTGSGKSDIKLIERMIRWAPRGLKFHLVHMGNNASGHLYFIPRFHEWISEGLDVICDTSWARSFAVRWAVREAIQNETLSDRILFASDEPWGDFSVERANVMEATRGLPNIRKRILFENATRIYGRR